MNLALRTGPLEVAALRDDINTLIKQLNAQAGLLNAQTSNAGNNPGSSAGSTDDTLFQHVFAANDMANLFPVGGPGLSGFRVTGWATTAANANNKTVKLLLGATTLISTGAVALNNGVIRMEAIVFRIGVSLQRIIGSAYSGATLIASSATDGTVDETAQQILRLTGNTGTLNDVLGKGFMAEMLR